MYLNHETKTQIPEEFLAIGLEDYSYCNDEVGCMGHPKIEEFLIYPCADYLEVCHGNELVQEIPEKWFLSNFNCPEDSEKELTTAEVVEWFKNKLEEV